MENEKREIKLKFYQVIIIFLLILLFIFATVFIVFKSKNKEIEVSGGKISIGKKDDWEFDSSKTNMSTNKGGSSLGGILSSADSFSSSTSSLSPSSIGGTNIGLSTGGAKDINNFRENIENGYFPISTDITYNGLFYDYVFDTGNTTESTELFSPSYSCAVSKDPISEQEEYYMTVGLNSNIKESDFSRKKLNLVVVLDISGSMGSNFNSYYYDDPLNEKENDNKSKMQIANESVNILIEQLESADRFGMVLFDDEAYIGKPISLVGETDIEAIKGHILEIQPNGGTNFEAGYTKATELFKEYKNIDSNEYENRIIVITDAMPNYGDTSKNSLLSYVKNNSNDGIYTTFIGVGVDFNTELTEAISDVKGANYYSVHNSEEFKERMGEQFEYMVTPLVFDLELNLNSADFEIVAVYGSDTVNKANGSIMKINTLFPSKTTDSGEVKGGVVLLKLNKKNNENEGDLTLNVSYKNREGKSFNNSQTVNFKTASSEYYDNTGIRKAILLTRYANVLKNWILYERSESDKFLILPTKGIIDCIYTEEQVVVLLGENERRSTALTVSNSYKETFTKIKEYIENENKEIKDETINKEVNILNKLITF